ncbi:YggT family protein [Candidatus Gottesmanbacteria bacterium]|nr:YggT family protein [Candidatus Gottesmanbacteria bacterium]
MIEPQITEVQEVTTVSTPTAQQVVRKTRIVPPVVTESPQKVYEAKKVIFRTYQIVWYILGVIEVLLTFRVILKLLGANPLSSFTNFIYAISDPFALPFAGILRTSASSGMLLEWSTLIAMTVYAIIAYGIVSLLQLIKPTTPQEVEHSVDNP